MMFLEKLLEFIDIADVIAVAMLVLMLAALVGAFCTRRNHGQGRSITHRFIQLVGMTWVLGATVILGLHGTLDGVPGTILGAIAGYVFAMERHDGGNRARPADPG